MGFILQAACAFGLEALVKRELGDLGYTARIVGPGKLEFMGDAASVCRANLWLRTADRVSILVKQFEATDFDQLFETTKAIDWSTWLPHDASFPVIGRSYQSQLSSVPACQRSVKRAIVDSLKSRYAVSSLDESGDTYQVEIALRNDIASLTIDTTGPSLHKRGYRKRGGAAPLKETLAAALVSLSFWKADRPLIDPFCGSGTIPIEAALIGRNIAPGLYRRFASEAWPIVTDELWVEARQEAQQLIRDPLSETIIGTDADPEVIKLARVHAARAGVDKCIHWQQKQFEQLFSKRPFGCTIMNPPYGDRLKNQHQAKQLYRSFPSVLQRLPTWSHFILTSYPKFESLIEKSAHRRRKLYNGRIECTYYQFHGPRKPPEASDQPSEIVARAADNYSPVFGGISEKTREQATLFAARLSKRARHLRRWPGKRGITCYRIYERDIPEIPLIVDRYEDHLHLVLYERPHQRDLGQQAAWLELMAKTAASTLGVDRRHVFVKQRVRQDDRLQHERASTESYQIPVQEGGLKFLVNLSDYIDTGLFLDHRNTRAMVRDVAAATRFLNLFGYTGSFTVYASAGGAKTTTTVDWSPTYLQWAEQNMSLNQFTGGKHRFIRQDSMTFLKSLPREPLYDLVVADPPTYSNSKRSEVDWDVQRDHAEMLNQIIARLSPGGVIYFSTNFRRFKFHEAEIANVKILEISKQTVPEDFRNRRIHRCWHLRKV